MPRRFLMGLDVANKSRATPSARWATQRHGLSRDSCDTSVSIYIVASPLLAYSATGPEVEARLAGFHAKHGQVMFGGKLLSETDGRFAIPDNLGGDAQRSIGAPPA